MAEMQVFTVISEINNLMETSRKVPLSNLIERQPGSRSGKGGKAAGA